MLSKKLHLPFLDLDEELEKKLGKIRPFIAARGMEAFRREEKKCLKQLLTSDFDGILAIGGGAAIENQKLLKKEVCIHLKEDPENVWQRIQKTGPTPLFKSKKEFQELWEQRLPIYDSLATLTLETPILPSFNAVTGLPIRHSQSPALHNKIYKKKKLSTVLLPLPIPSAKDAVKVIRDCKIPLTAVTMPHKESILPFLDSLDPIAKELGAVNTVLQKNGKLHGTNTDIHGIESALKHLDLRGKKTLILGAGGAAKAAAHVLKQKGAIQFFHNRNQERAEALSHQFGGEVLHDLSHLPKDLSLAVNATPVNPLGSYRLRPTTFAFDMIYKPKLTPFLKSVSGGQRIFGQTMFVAQAQQQIKLYQEYIKQQNPHDHATD